MAYPKEVLRYNQGFGVFGPLEQCGNGRFVEASDFDAVVSDLENQTAITDKFARELSDAHFEIGRLRVEVSEVKEEAEKALLNAKEVTDLFSRTLGTRIKEINEQSREILELRRVNQAQNMVIKGYTGLFLVSLAISLYLLFGDRI